MSLTLRRGTAEDAKACGTICFEAFRNISEAHNFTPDFPSADVAIGLLTWMLAHRGFYSTAAELDGRIVGSNFLDERNSIAGLGPITVDPAVQNKAIGRRLMEDAHRRAAEKNFPGVRLVQAAFHGRSLSLYAKLGYDVREPLACMQGPPLDVTIPSYAVRAATEADVDACNRVCRQVHGHDRAGELLDAIKKGTATVVETGNEITGYATVVGFFGRAVGESNTELKALIGICRPGVFAAHP
jgi:GNAT superfamily N-acetyltransferase